MRVYLLRHGKTEANEKGLYCGSTDLPLSQAGKAELQSIRYILGDVTFITSGMKRTIETLQLLFGDVPYRVEPRFREMDFGAFEMCGYEDLKNRADYQAWLTGNNEENVPPGGESGLQMKERVLQAFSEIREDACIVVHGGVIAVIMAHLFPEEGKSRYAWQPKNGHGYVIEGNCYRCL